MRSFLLFLSIFVSSVSLAEGQARFFIHPQVLKELNPDVTPSPWDSKRWENYVTYKPIKFVTEVMAAGTQDTGDAKGRPVEVTRQMKDAIRDAQLELLQFSANPEFRMYGSIDPSPLQRVSQLYYVTQLRLEIYPANGDETVLVRIAPKNESPNSENSLVVRAAFNRNGEIPLDVRSINKGLENLLDTNASTNALKGATQLNARIEEENAKTQRNRKRSPGLQ